jgi:hypothetical protein
VSAAKRKKVFLDEIKRIDFIIHPFYSKISPEDTGRKVTEQEYSEIVAEWYRCINEALADKTRAVIIDSQATILREEEELLAFARKLGNRLLLRRGYGYEDYNGNFFSKPIAALKAHGFFVKPSRLKTRAMGELTLRCVFGVGTRINADLGLQNPVPYKNPQSSILPKRSIDGIVVVTRQTKTGRIVSVKEKGYPSPAERREMQASLKRNRKRAVQAAKKRMQAFVGAKAIIARAQTEEHLLSKYGIRKPGMKH